jgi:hypothetical protein
MAGGIMSILRTFLKEQAQEQRATKAQRMEAIAEWKQALDSLISQVEHWLREADQANVLKVQRIPVTIRERQLGIYQVEELRVRLGPRELCVTPMVRYSIGLTVGDETGTRIRDGKVTMSRGDKGYGLFRRKGESGDEWVIVDERRYQPGELNRSTFEAAVLDLLK